MDDTVSEAKKKVIPLNYYVYTNSYHLRFFTIRTLTWMFVWPVLALDKYSRDSFLDVFTDFLCLVD